MLKLKDRLANHRILLFGAPFLLLWLLAFVSEDGKIVLGKDKLIASESYASEADAIYELMSFSESVTEDFTFVAQQSGTIGTYDSAEELQHTAYSALGEMYHSLTGNELDTTLIAEHADRYEFDDVEAGVHVNVSINGLKEQNQAWLTVRLQMKEAASAEQLLNIKKRLDHSLSSLQNRTIWTYTIQGNLADDAQSENVFHKIETRWNAIAIGNYQDAGSASISYDASIFSSLSENHRSFQAAVHTHSETGQSRLTIGIPAIGIEY